MSINKEQYSIGDLFKKIINNQISKIHTSIPAEVVVKNGNNVDVRPLIEDINLNNEFEELPIIANVPIQVFRNSNAIISIPVNIGDTGTLSFAERSIKNWQLQGGLQSPEDKRRFNLTDCYFCPNIMVDGSGLSINSDINIILKNSSIIIKDNGDINITSSGTLNLEATDIKIGASAVEPVVKGTTLQTLINSFISTYNSHTHGATSTPDQLATLLTGTELSTKSKVE